MVDQGKLHGFRRLNPINILINVFGQKAFRPVTVNEHDTGTADRDNEQGSNIKENLRLKAYFYKIVHLPGFNPIRELQLGRICFNISGSSPVPTFE